MGMHATTTTTCPQACSSPLSRRPAVAGASSPFILAYSMLLRCFLLACLSFAGALLAGWGLNHVLTGPHPAPDLGSDAFPMLLTIAAVVVVSPLAEALLLAWLFNQLSRHLAPRWSAWWAGTLFAAAQSTFYWPWGLVVWFPSLVFTVPFLRSSRPGRERILSSALIHMFHNTMGVILILAT